MAPDNDQIEQRPLYPFPSPERGEGKAAPSPEGGEIKLRAPRELMRLASIDAYRGFVMFLMMAEVLRLGQVVGSLKKAGVDILMPSNDVALADWVRRIGENGYNLWSFLALHQ